MYYAININCYLLKNLQKKASYTNLELFFNSIDWKFHLSNNNLESNVYDFHQILNQGLKTFVPTCKYTNATYPVWFTKELKDVLCSKKSAHVTYKISSSASGYLKFKFLRSQRRILNRQCYSRYLKSSEEMIKSDVKYFWTFIKSNKKSPPTPNVLLYNDHMSCCD